VSVVDVLWFIQTSRFAHAIAKANHLLIASLQIIHVFGFIFLLAPLVLVDLRVLGLVLHDQPLRDIVGQCRRLSLLGLSMSLTSGLLMFLSAPLHYYSNWAFDAKMELLAIALVVYIVLFIGVPAWDSAHPWLAKLTACLSLVLWIGVCMAGRAIGFT
jgi:hypothetical protein